MSFDVYNDPSHGWVKVARSLLSELGIADQITRYSYQRESWVYLEEDCDASTLIEALKARGIVPKFRDHYCDGRSRIREYEPYSQEVILA